VTAKEIKTPVITSFPHNTARWLRDKLAFHEVLEMDDDPVDITVDANVDLISFFPCIFLMLSTTIEIIKNEASSWHGRQICFTLKEVARTWQTLFPLRKQKK
jgi:hypothetical protein